MRSYNFHIRPLPKLAFAIKRDGMETEATECSFPTRPSRGGSIPSRFEAKVELPKRSILGGRFVGCGGNLRCLAAMGVHAY